VQGLFKAPYLYDEDSELPLGNGQEDFEGKLLFGKSFGELGYGGLEVGYRIRTEDPVDEFRYLVEYGFDLNERTYLRTKLDGIHAASSSDLDTAVLTPEAALNPQLPLERHQHPICYRVLVLRVDRYVHRSDPRSRHPL